MKYLKGLFFKAPHKNAPDFVLAKASIKRTDLIETLQGLSDDYINLDIKRGKDGDVYASIDDWKPSGDQEKQPETPTAQQLESDDDLPF